MTRPLRAFIDLHALRHNLDCVRRLSPDSKIMAIIKADGYGHGLQRVAAALHQANAFGLASLEEALQLREAGIAHPLCLLEGFFEPAELPPLTRHRIATVIHNEEQLQVLEQSRLAGSLDVWIKIDTGMHRIGFPPERLAEVLNRVTAIGLISRIGIMSHLANADDPADAYTDTQIAAFQSACDPFTKECSLANSAGIVAWPASRLDWVRPGIMLYGASPVHDRDPATIGLQPVMRLESRLIAANRFRKGDAVGYQGAWVCPEDMPVGVVACGYGDGYPRHAPTGTPVLIDGRRVPLIGRVSMDMITVDLRDIPDPRVGAPAVLWGDGIAVAEIADRAGTIAYELLCGVTGRVPRIEVEHGG